MPRSRNPDILRKVLANRLLARIRQPKQLLPILKPVVNPPHVEGDMLTQMAQNHLEFGVSVEDPVGDHAQDMQTDAVGEAKRWTDEPLPVCPELVVDASCGVAGVQVQGDVQVGAGLPENVPFRLVVEDHVIPVWSGALGVVY